MDQEGDKLMFYKQVRLKNGNTETVTWVDLQKRFKKGDRITLKGETKLWDIKEVYNCKVEKSQIRNDWNVGGL